MKSVKSEVIADTAEKYTSIIWCPKGFFESFSFVNGNVDALVTTIKHEDFLLARKAFGERWQFVKQKEVLLFEA